MQTIIKLENLCCKSGHRYFLHNINWDIQKGDHWVLFGLNGCGKTTLLSIIAGFNKFTSGKLTIFGEEYNKDNILDYRSRIGWVSSSFFDKYYSIESAMNIVLSGLTGTLGISRFIMDEEVKRAEQLLRAFQLGGQMNQPFNFMSKGERQKVLIARALISEPEIVILDEPGTGLDIIARDYMFDMIDDLAGKGGQTIIYVTHYVEEILTDAFEKMLLLKNGEIYEQGSTKELLNTETFSEYLSHDVRLYNNDGRFDIVLGKEV